jgi:DNA primase
VIEDKPLPKDSIPLLKLLDTQPALAIEILEEVIARKLNPERQELFWSPEYPDRFVIPFKYQGRSVGYTARKIGEGRPKYISDQNPGYVFNLDNQNADRKHVIVVEGPIDALSIDGVAILGANIMDKQSMLINRLNKHVILLPDRDENGMQTVEQAIKLGWSVSMPDWEEDVKDANDAVKAYGRIYTLKSIVDSAERTEVKIRLRAKSWLKRS